MTIKTSLQKLNYILHIDTKFAKIVQCINTSQYKLIPPLKNNKLHRLTERAV